MAIAPATQANLRKLHSLTGVIPVGLFLLEHFFTNSFALFGAEAFNDKVRFLTSLPYVVALEIGLIGAPLAFHAILGVAIWWQSRSNVSSYGYFRNWMFLVQRLTGVFLVGFIVVHVAKTRFSGVAADEMFQHMQGYLSSPVWAAFYAIGVLSASFHFGNGLFTFGISWGLLPGVRSQRWAQWAAMAVFVGMSFVGLNSILAFRGQPLEIFNKDEPIHGMRAGSEPTARPPARSEAVPR